jgi:hypothetical protein
MAGRLIHHSKNRMPLTETEAIGGYRMNNDLKQNATRIEQRVKELEQRLTAMERLLYTAIGHDASLGEDSAMLQALVVEGPGMSQTGVCRVARQRFGFSRPRVVEVLRRGVGKHWRVQAGAYNSVLYFPCERAPDTHAASGHVLTESDREVIESS